MFYLKLYTYFILILHFRRVFARQGFGPGNQEWGFVTVRPKAHMFWWLYYSNANTNFHENRPLIIWLQGGPGGSSTGIGNFGEIGPIDSQFKIREHTWVKDYNVLFIDNPVGTGFSYVESLDVLPKTNSEIANDLVRCIAEFFRNMTRFSRTPTFILAESYGGKMGVEFANLWYKEQTKGNIDSNLRGIGLIDSSISAIDNYSFFASYLLHMGFVDMNGFNVIDTMANNLEATAKAEEWSKVVHLTQEIENLIVYITNNMDWYNILKKVKPKTEIAKDELYEFMNGPVKSKLGLKNRWGDQSYHVFMTLLEDNMKPVINQVEELLNESTLKVYVLTAQLDFIMNTPGTLKWIHKMNWNNASQWAVAPRIPLIIDDVIEGYRKGYGRFKLFWVNRSGHMIPIDNPVAMKEILEDLVE